MATFRTVRMSFWDDMFIASLPLTQRFFYLYLFTSCPSNIGVFERPMCRIVCDTSMKENDVEKALAVLESNGKIIRDGQQILILNFIKHQTSRSPRVVAGLRAEFKEIKSMALRTALASKYPEIFAGEFHALDHQDTITIPSKNFSIPSNHSEKPSETDFRPSAENERPSGVKVLGKGRGSLGKSKVLKEHICQNSEDEAASSSPLEADASAPQLSLFDSPEEECVTLEQVASLWNEMMVPEGFASVNMNLLSEDRRAHLRGRQRTFKDARGIKFWKKIFTVVLRSSFLRGDRTDWKANFDFCIESNKKLRKIIEGGYDDNKPVETWIPYDGENAA